MAKDLQAVVDAVQRQTEGLRLWGIKDLPMAAEQRTGQRSAALRRLDQDVKACTRCPLFRTRTHHVLGEGRADAELVFVGEAPGREEDLQGRPFVGAAGQLLTKMIEAMGLRREEVYICNVLKDRPPGNRTPLPEEVEACLPFLAQQLAVIHPTVICALGSVATKALLGAQVSIMQIRGQQHDFGGIPLIPTLHPAYLLRNPPAKRLVWQDLKRVKRLLEERRARPPAQRAEAGGRAR